MVTRILVVDDFDPFLSLMASKMRNDAELQLIGEASDGVSAVQKAATLRPDLILLDIGLPLLGGIDAARQIRKLTPQSKILFVSQESSPEIVQAALEIGAQGYILKSDLGRELLTAIRAVIRGELYITSSLTRHNLTIPEIQSGA